MSEELDALLASAQRMGAQYEELKRQLTERTAIEAYIKRLMEIRDSYQSIVDELNLIILQAENTLTPFESDERN